jgi:pseudaminic acid synthase
MSKTPYITIDNKKIGIGNTPYFIAEMSANHNGDINNAYEIIRVAKECGAQAVKIQTYTPDTITLDSDYEDFKISTGLWAGKTLYELYSEAYMPWEWHRELFDYAKKIGITLFSSPFDKTAIDLLENLNAPAYKIASFEIVDIPLIRYAASTKKPIIISTGMASKEEIDEAVDACKAEGNEDICLLVCTSGYPARAEDYNLMKISSFSKRYGLPVGLSDHTLGNIAGITSVGLGATIFEKHFTLDRARGGPDDGFSIEPNELKELVLQLSESWASIGSDDYTIKPVEKESVKHRRSLYFVKKLKKGDFVTKDSIRSIRPGFGMKPKHFDDIQGKKLALDVEIGMPVKPECLE